MNEKPDPEIHRIGLFAFGDGRLVRINAYIQTLTAAKSTFGLQSGCLFG
jgi:hypothetical protein